MHLQYITRQSANLTYLLLTATSVEAIFAKILIKLQNQQRKSTRDDDVLKCRAKTIFFEFSTKMTGIKLKKFTGIFDEKLIKLNHFDSLKIFIFRISFFFF